MPYTFSAFADGQTLTAARLDAVRAAVETIAAPKVYLEKHGALGTGLAANATANDAAMVAAIAEATALGATGYLGAEIVMPPGVFDFSVPWVWPRTGTTPTNVVGLAGSNDRPTVCRTTAGFPAGRALIEWADTASRVQHQHFHDFTINLQPGPLGVRAIHFKLSGTVTTEAQVIAQWFQFGRFARIVVEGQGSYSNNAVIKFEGGVRHTDFIDVHGDPSQGTYDVPLFEFDWLVGSSGNPPTVAADSVGYEFGTIDGSWSTIRRAGWSRLFKGRMYFSTIKNANCNGGKSGNAGVGIHLINSFEYTLENITQEGQGEAAQYRLENARRGHLRHVGIGTPDATDAAWVASHAYVLGDRVVPTTLKQLATAARNAYYACTTAGTSGSGEPTWPASGTVSDGGVVWTYQGAAVGNGLELVNTTDTDVDGRHEFGGHAAFSQRAVSALTIDAISHRNVFSAFDVKEVTAGTAGAEMTNAGTSNQISGYGISGSLGSETFTPYAIGSHPQYPVFLVGSKTHDFASVADGATSAVTTVTVAGAAVGDLVTAALSTNTTAKVAIQAQVTAADTVSCWVQNDSGGPVDVASGTLTAQVRKVA
jgi:hypothetical protein